MGYDLVQHDFRLLRGKVVQSKVGTDIGQFYSMRGKTVKDFFFFLKQRSSNSIYIMTETASAY